MMDYNKRYGERYVNQQRNTPAQSTTTKTSTAANTETANTHTAAEPDSKMSLRVRRYAGIYFRHNLFGDLIHEIIQNSLYCCLHFIVVFIFPTSFQFRINC